MSLGQLTRFLLRKARLLFAFLDVVSMCAFKVKLSAMVTPRYFPVLFTVRSCQVGLTGFRLMTSHLLALNDICQSLPHSCSLSRSSCRIRASSGLFILRYRGLSSAKRRVVEDALCGKSLM